MPYRPGPVGWTRCARASRLSSRAGLPDGGAGQRGGGVARQSRGRGAGPAAGTRGRRPASRCRQDQENTARTAVRGSPAASSRSSRRCWSASSPTRSASGTAGTGGGELGGHPQRQRQPSALGGQRRRPRRDRRPARSPISARSSPTASAVGSRSRSSRRAPSLATSPASASRLVTTATQPGVPGSSGRTCSTDPGVVQHDQHPPPGQQAPVPGRPLVGPGRDVRAGHAQGAQEPGQRVGRRHRLVRVVAAQVHVQLPVREPVRDLVRPVHRQRGLAHPRRPADRRDHHGPRRLSAGLVQQPVSAASSAARPANCGTGPGQLPRHHGAGVPTGPLPGRPMPAPRRRQAGGCTAELGGACQDLLVQRAQLRRRARRPARRPAPAGPAGRRPAPRPGRPHRYRASISRAWKCSRSGWRAARSRSSGTSCSWRPCVPGPPRCASPVPAACSWSRCGTH